MVPIHIALKTTVWQADNMCLLKYSCKAVSATDLLRRLLFSSLKNPTKQTTKNELPSTPSQCWLSYEINRPSIPIYLARSHILHCSVAGSTSACKLIFCPKDCSNIWGKEEKKNLKRWNVKKEEKHQILRLGSFNTKLLYWGDPDVFTSGPPIMGFCGGSILQCQAKRAA